MRALNGFILIDTPLQRSRRGSRNRFNGLPHPAETVETVSGRIHLSPTPLLKRGANKNPARAAICKSGKATAYSGSLAFSPLTL